MASRKKKTKPGVGLGLITVSSAPNPRDVLITSFPGVAFEEDMLGDPRMDGSSTSYDPLFVIELIAAINKDRQTEGGGAEYMNNILQSKTLFDSYVYENSRKQSEIDIELMRNKPREIGKGVYKCPACGSTNTAYVEKQIRSSDEPMDIKAKCLQVTCGKSWKV